MARPPADSGGGKGKLIGNIVFFAFLIGVGVYFAIGMMAPSDDPIYSQQLDPESAMIIYLDHADGFIHNASTAGNVEKTITKGDWDWLQDNHEQIFADRDAIGLGSAADPTVVQHGGRLAVLSLLLKGGPNRKDAQIIETKLNGESNAELIVREKDFYGDGDYDYTDYRVRLVKEGKYWKVKDYATGKQALEGTRQPEDAVHRGREEVESGVAAIEPGPGALEEANNSAAAAAGIPGVPAGAGEISTIEQADAAVLAARRAWEAGDAQTAYTESLKAYNVYQQQLGPQHQKTQQTMAMGRAARERLAQ